MEREKIGFVVGFMAEARLLYRFGLMGGIGGGTPEGARAVAEILAGEGAEALVSFGLAGGLNPTLTPGTLVVPRAVAEDGETHECDPGLTAWLGGATAGAMLAGARIAASATEKATLFAQTGCDAIDLESGAVARVAAAHGVPYAVLRAIADPAGRDLPPAALVALDGQGKIGFWRVLGAVARQPVQIPALLALARDAGAARAALLKGLERLPKDVTGAPPVAVQ